MPATILTAVFIIHHNAHATKPVCNHTDSLSTYKQIS